MISNAETPRTAHYSTFSALKPLIDWIDRELMDSYQTASGRGGDTLLQLRQILSGNHLNAAIGGFYRLLPRLERDHFLLGYRIRHWVSLNFEILISDPFERVEPQRIAIRVNDRNLKTCRERFVRAKEDEIDPFDLRIQIVEKLFPVREVREKMSH